MAKKMVSCFQKFVRIFIDTSFNFFIQLELLHLSWKCNTDIEQDRKKKNTSKSNAQTTFSKYCSQMFKEMLGCMVMYL